MILINIILSVIVIIFLFFISMTIPVFTYFIPYYKIRNLHNKNFIVRYMVNILVLLVLYLLDFKIICTYYLLFPFFMELYLIHSLKKLKKVDVFNHICMGSFLTFSFMMLWTYFNRIEILRVLNISLEQYALKNNINVIELQNSLPHILGNLPAVFFLFISISYFMLYYSFFRNSYIHWRISPYWLLLFVISVFMTQFLNINNIFTETMIHIVKIIYTLFGIKSIYKLLTKKNKKSILNQLVSIMTAIILPFITFLIGAFMSFNIDIKIKEWRK